MDPKRRAEYVAQLREQRKHEVARYVEALVSDGVLESTKEQALLVRLAGIGLSADDAMAAIAAALEAMGAQRGGGGFGIGGVDEELLELVLACMHEVAGAQLLDDAGMDAPPPQPVPRVRETSRVGVGHR